MGSVLTKRGEWIRGDQSAQEEEEEEEYKKE